MSALVKEIRHKPLLWLLAFVPMVFTVAKLKHEAHTLLFVLSVLAIVPLAALLSHATESLAAKTGDAVGGLLNARLGNWTELVIMMLIATLTVSLVTNSGRSTWFVGVCVLAVYLIFAMTLYLLPPQVQ